MAGIIKEEMEMKNTEIKEEIPEDILSSSTAEDPCAIEDTCTVEDPCSIEDTCTVYIKEEDVKVEITETKGKTNN